MHCRLLHLALLSLASLLATGCYCPMLSGRYGDCCGFPPGSPPTYVAPSGGEVNYAPFSAPHCCWLSTLLPGLGPGLGGGDNSVPSEQGPDYLSPPAKFHPIPTRPVFESQAFYPPTELLEPAGGNPLRPATATIATARATAQPASLR